MIIYIYIHIIYIHTYCSLNPPIIINKSSFIHEIARWVKLETNNHFLNLPNDKIMVHFFSSTNLLCLYRLYTVYIGYILFIKVIYCL